MTKKQETSIVSHGSKRPPAAIEGWNSQTGVSSTTWGQLKWRLNMETTRITPPRVSKNRCHPAIQPGRPLFNSPLSCSIRNRTRVVTEVTTDFSNIHFHFESKNLPRTTHTRDNKYYLVISLERLRKTMENLFYDSKCLNQNSNQNGPG
jgi:hypothetical protein